MNKALKVVGLGLAIEAALIGVAMTNIGPCGPATPLGILALAIHTPGLIAVEAFNFKEPFSLILIAIGYTCVWSSIAYLILRKPTPGSKVK